MQELVMKLIGPMASATTAGGGRAATTAGNHHHHLSSSSQSPSVPGSPQSSPSAASSPPSTPPTATSNTTTNDDGDTSCHPHAPYEMLSSTSRTLFGWAIFLTAAITLALNLCVITTLVINRHRQKCRNNHHHHHHHQKQNGSTSSSSSSSTDPKDIWLPITSINSSSSNGQQNLSPSRRISSIVAPPTPSSTSYSHTHQSFISLSISVIIYSSICVPAMYLKTVDNNFKNPSEIIMIFFFYVSPIASSFMHLLMAFDRYLAIKQCFNFHRYWYRRHYTLSIVVLWLISILIVIPFLWYKNYSRTIQIILTLARLMFTFSIPSLLTLWLYVAIAFELDRARKSELIFSMTLVQNAKLISRHRKIIAKIIGLACTHFLCWFPFSVIESINDLFPNIFPICTTDKNVHIYYGSMAILILITSMSGIAYPILYCFVSNEFRKIFRSKLRILPINNMENNNENKINLHADETTTATNPRSSGLR